MKDNRNQEGKKGTNISHHKGSKQYKKPCLVEYGTIEKLTQGSKSSGILEGGGTYRK